MVFTLRIELNDDTRSYADIATALRDAAYWVDDHEEQGDKPRLDATDNFRRDGKLLGTWKITR